MISDSVDVEIFAIGQPCAKIFSKVWCATFFWDTVYLLTAIKHPLAHRVKPSFVIFDIRALWHSPERQSARMSKITNDG